jgi:hypothetical protein
VFRVRYKMNCYIGRFFKREPNFINVSQKNVPRPLINDLINISDIGLSF